MMVTI